MAVCFRCNAETPPDANFCHRCGASLEKAGGEFRAGGDPLIGMVIAQRYRILSLIGRGGMGVVYKGEHIHMGKSVALKLMHGELSGHKELVRRFKREAEAVSRLSSVHTVTIFDYGQSHGLIYLVMEYLEGVDLAQLIRKCGYVELKRCLLILLQICASLGEAHEVGIIHRDLKPENVFLIERDGLRDFVKVLDFGLAKVRKGFGSPEETAHGVVVGTPYYMAPEQIRGEKIDVRADIYSLGALLFTMINGTPPFVAPTPLAVMAHHLTSAVPKPEFKENVSEETASTVSSVIRKCMDKEPENRYSDVNQLKSEILKFFPLLAGGSSPSEELESAALLQDVSSPASTGEATEGLRQEFEKYERMLRMRRIAYFVLPILIIFISFAGIYLFLKHMPARGDGFEEEPNNTPGTANVINPGQTKRGYIGKRISLSASDHDWYRVTVPEGFWVMNVKLSPFPDMDFMIQLFKQGQQKPVAEGREGRRGEPETIMSVGVEGATYYILVREDRSRSGRRPMENFSDTYGLKVELLPAFGRETEPNGIPEKANVVYHGEKLVGYIANPFDIDIFRVVIPEHRPFRVVLKKESESKATGNTVVTVEVYDSVLNLVKGISSDGDVITLPVEEVGFTSYYYVFVKAGWLDGCDGSCGKLTHPLKYQFTVQ